MRVFVDSTVISAASVSPRSSSRKILERAQDRGWRLVTSLDCRTEVRRKLERRGTSGQRWWARAESRFLWASFPLTDEHPVLRAAAKANPVLMSAIIDRSALLLTNDRRSFVHLIGQRVYGVWITTPEMLMASSPR